MADYEGPKDGLKENVKEPQTDSADVSENLRIKLTTMNNELQDTLKIVDSYKEDKRVAVNTKNELEESKKKISLLQTRLSESESTCKRYRNERNNLRQDLARLVQEKKQMISYEEDVQQLKRENEMQKNRYDRNDREWKNKQTDMENRYDEIINEQKQKIASAEQDVQRLTKELEMQKDTNEQEKRIFESQQKESKETNQNDYKQEHNEVEQNEDVLGERDAKMKRHKQRDILETNKNGYIVKGGLNESLEDGAKYSSYKNNDGLNSEITNQDSGEQLTDKSEQDVEVIEKRGVKAITRENVIESRKYDDIDGKEVQDSFEDITAQPNDDHNRKPDSEFVTVEPETYSETITKMKDKENDVDTETTDPCDGLVTKNLGVRYEELFNTQWTSAYEKMLQLCDSEEEAIEALFDILQDIMNFCRSKSQEQIDDLYRVLTFSADQKDGNVTDNITKHLKECMRELSSEAKDYLYGLYPLSLQKKSSRALQYLMDIEDFTKESFELCWLMVIQDPPVVFCPTAEKGDVLDLNVYKAYKTSGRYVTFTVFPALLLHENGPVLAKGVAEGDDQPQTKHKHDSRRKNKGTPKYHDHEIKDELEVSDRDHFSRRDVLKYEYRYDAASRNKTPVTDRYNYRYKYESGVDGKDEFKTGKEMKDVENHYISRDQGKFRDKVRFVPEDDMDFHDRESIPSMHEMRFEDRSSRGRGSIDDFILHEERSVSDRDDFLRHDIKDFSKRADLVPRDGGNYSDRGHFHTTPLYEKDSTPHLYHRRLESTHDHTLSENARWENYHRANIPEEETSAYSQSIIKTKSRGTTNVLKPSYGYERNPTADEMRLYFQYVDCHDHTGARDVLGHAAYMRCLRNDQKNHLHY